MKQLIRLMITLSMIAGFAACGDKKDSAERSQEAQRAMQEGAQKEKAMIEGMQKGVENMEKKEATKK